MDILSSIEQTSFPEDRLVLKDVLNKLHIQFPYSKYLIQSQVGLYCSRMTGAGFGGCTVSIVKDEAVDSFIEKVGAAYKDKIGYAADFYVVEIGDGPAKLA